MATQYIKKIIRSIRNSHAVNEMQRIGIRVSKWKNDADSPVILMIDDLTNAWVETRDVMKSKAYGDWGGHFDSSESIFSFLTNNLYSVYPEIKTTFFMIAGTMSSFNTEQPFDFAKPIDFNKTSVEFFRKVWLDNRFEIGYHGLTHGIPQKKSEHFIQEWCSFENVEEGLRKITAGLGIFKEVFGEYPNGGKYGGWKYNEFSDETIDRSGFIWWFRDWMPRKTDGSIINEYYEPQVFGNNNVIALPSTIHGSHWSKRQIIELLKNRQIISIEEHIGALRPDLQIQTPNVFDDIGSLRRLFKYLRNKNVWHANASEIADYYRSRVATSVKDVKKDSFSIYLTDKNIRSEVTIVIQPHGNLKNNVESGVEVICPGGKRVIGVPSHEKNQILFNIIPKEGTYKIKTLSGR